MGTGTVPRVKVAGA